MRLEDRPKGQGTEHRQKSKLFRTALPNFFGLWFIMEMGLKGGEEGKNSL